MLKVRAGLVLAVSLIAVQQLQAAAWPPPQAPAVPGTDGYIDIPNAAVPPVKSETYKAIYNATQAPSKPTEVVPALNMAGSELNALAVAKVPLENAKFVVVFHGPAIDGILDNAHYKAKYGVDNPNLRVLSDLRKAGVSIFVCGQNVAAINMDPATISPDVTVASDALIVLMHYENQGYALLDF
jgi:intracellular sulfur oxidation DsrE/DsrF family protein